MGGMAFFQGVFEKTCVFCVVFGGENVVNCWWNCGAWRTLFERRKFATFLKYFCGKIRFGCL
jgi:hypothetical protein